MHDRRHTHKLKNLVGVTNCVRETDALQQAHIFARVKSGLDLINIMEIHYTSVLNSSTTLTRMDFTMNTTEEFDMHQYLEQMMGAKRRDLASVGILTFVYVLIFLTGIAGNVCTCIVIARNTYMHTATNYYLFSLAMSDMLTLVFGKQFQIVLQTELGLNTDLLKASLTVGHISRNVLRHAKPPDIHKHVLK